MATGLLHNAPGGVLLVGDYGSGKTEVSVNLAIRLAAELRGERQVAIADLDLVNPYFRCREAAEPLRRAGIRVVMPGGGHQFADLPILLPQVKGLLQDPDTLAVLDVGGDEAGSRVLSALGSALDPAHHGFWFVVNKNRPFCDTPEGCVDVIRGIEASAGARVTGVVANTHLMDETTPGMVIDGVALSREVARILGVELALVAAMEAVAGALDPGILGAPLLTMRRLMVPPWIRRPEQGPQMFKLGQGGA